MDMGWIFVGIGSIALGYAGLKNFTEYCQRQKEDKEEKEHILNMIKDNVMRGYKVLLIKENGKSGLKIRFFKSEENTLTSESELMIGWPTAMYLANELKLPLLYKSVTHCNVFIDKSHFPTTTSM